MLLKGEIPFVRLLIPLMIGIVIALEWPGRELLAGAFASAISGIGLIALLISFYKSLKLFRRKWIIGILIHSALIFCGVFLTLKTAGKFDKDFFATQASDALIVTVKNEPQLSGEILRFETLVDQSIQARKISPVSGKLLIAFRRDSLNPLEVKYGDRLLIPSRYDDVAPPFNPAEFNYKKHLEGKQIYKQAFVNQQDIKILRRNTGNKIIAFALSLRQKLVKKFYSYLDDKEAAAMASTLILGYRSNLSKEVINAYSKTGTLHILSVSGMHVAIVFLVLAFLMRPLARNRKLRLLSALIIIISIWFYALITGFSPSVCRAAMMLSFLVLGKSLNKTLNTYNLLAISAFFLLIYNPYNLVDVGFQLSYLAVIGLVYLQPKIYHLLQPKNKALDYLWSYSALSIAAQLATFPISVYYFHQFPVYFLISNLLVVLPVALIMYGGLAFLIIPWSFLLNPLGDLLNGLILLTNRALYFIEDLPFASFGGIWISTFQYLMMYLIILLVVWSVSTAKKHVAFASLGGILVLSLSITDAKIKSGNQKELIFFSLRENSAIAYINNRKAYLIDDVLGEKTKTFSIYPAIESRGVLEIKSIGMGSNFFKDEIRISPSYMQFGNVRIVRWSRELDNLKFPGHLKANIVLLSGNPRIGLKELKENITFSTLLIDASNSGYRVKQWQQEAALLNIPVHFLKKHPAYILKL